MEAEAAAGSATGSVAGGSVDGTAGEPAEGVAAEGPLRAPPVVTTTPYPSGPTLILGPVSSPRSPMPGASSGLGIGA